jgi:hypothetical protein
MGQETSQVVQHVGQLAGLTEITEANLSATRKLDDWDAAELFDTRLIELEKMARHSFVEMGLVCLEVQKRELWKLIVAPDWIDSQGVEHSGETFHSIDAWIMDRLGVSRASAYSAMKVLEANAPIDDLREMPRRNAVRFAKLSSAVQADPDIIEAAKGSEKSFLAKIQRDYPDQHIEKTRAIVAAPAITAREAMDLCFDVVCWAYDLSSREDVLENLCAYFMDNDCEREGWEGMKNRQAYDRATGKE